MSKKRRKARYVSFTTQIDAFSAIHFPSVQLIDTNERVELKTPDQLLVLGHHENGSIVSVDVNGTPTADTPFTFEILGTEGRLSLFGGDPHGFQGGERRRSLRAAQSRYPRLDLDCP